MYYKVISSWRMPGLLVRALAISGFVVTAGGRPQAEIFYLETDLVLEWKADAGSYCFLQYSTDLLNWSWDLEFLQAGSGERVQHPVSLPAPGINPVFYRLVITDDYDSEPMRLDLAGDGFPVGWKLRHGLNPRVALDPALDLDGDGRSLLEEYQSGTHPLWRDHPDVALIVMKGIL